MHFKWLILDCFCSGDNHGVTSLICAAEIKDSNVELTMLLLANGAVPNQGKQKNVEKFKMSMMIKACGRAVNFSCTVTNDGRNTALVSASNSGNLAVVKALLAKGASPNLGNTLR